MDHSGNADFEYLILGAGPAGLQLGHHLSRAGRSYMILERGQGPGEFFRKYPRHRTLISSNKVYTGYDDPEVNLRFDWNSLLSDDAQLLFKEYCTRYFPPADRMVKYLSDYAECFALNVRCNTEVVRVERTHSPQGFRLTDAEGNAFTCLRLIVAAGVTKPHLPDVPGVELAEVYTTVPVDPADFVNQRVLVVGKGNSAFETADNLVETTAVLHVLSPNPVRLAWQTHYVGHLRAVNNNFLDTYQLKSQNAVLDATLERIVRREDGKLAVSVRYTHAPGETEDLVYDRVILCTGFRFDNSFFDGDCRPELTVNDRFPALTCEWESTNVPDMFFAGTITQSRDFKKTASGFIHGFRYNTRSLFRMLEKRYHRKPWPARAVTPTVDGVLDAMISRINRTSALWQQYGFLHDLIVMPENGGPALHLEEMPLSYIQESELSASSHYYTITMEFGSIEGDPFAAVRKPAPGAAYASTFLHPVVRRWNGPLLVAEHHMLEDLHGEWTREDLHLSPLREFLREQMRERVRVLTGWD
ncbi:MAG TPA: NAD(P)-binding domain-containing protein [Thermoanaerobaculia bacterium]|jgi:thioredoxin reductase|nr:NAD(P)-binding domain-containing protein [Thermoanaerobaculia bacterium]